MTELYGGYRKRQEEQATRDRLANNPVAIVCLDLHRPVLSYQVQCTTCIDPYGHGGDGETWPCTNYQATREAAP